MTYFLLRSGQKGYWSSETGWIANPALGTRMTVDEALLESERQRPAAPDVAVVRMDSAEGRDEV